MKNLIGSIGESVRLKGSMAYQTILSGSIQTYVALKGSVAQFTRSLTTRANIITRVIVEVQAKVTRKIRNAFVNIKVTISARAKVFRKAKAITTIRTSMEVKPNVIRRISVLVGVDAVIGTSSLLANIKDRTLGEIKSLTLKQLMFTMGVVAKIVRVTGNAPINIKTEMNVVAKVIRKRTLGEIKSLTLGDIKNMTLNELIEYEV